jgi:3-oxoacyl-[acyl-carrier-protein] synthase-3
METSPSSRLGIAAISIDQPVWQLENGWFGDTMPRKFTQHTGIEARSISVDDEVTMGLKAVRRLQQESGCNLADCRGIVFVSPSFIPPSVARRHLTPHEATRERPGRAARQLAREVGVRRCRTLGLNWFCCGYSRAFSVVTRRWAPRLGLERDDFLLVVVATRISRITDYGCTTTGGLFGDMASATILAPMTSRRYPVHFEIVGADAGKQPVDRPAFDFHRRSHVAVPAAGGARGHDETRLVYSLDGMTIADLAPRAMSAAVVDGLAAAGLRGTDVDFVVPHQAGTGIVRFTGMKLEEAGVGGELINGLTRRTGNVSACSIPHALRESWSRLRGLVACPTAAVGSPGRPEVLQGCILLRSTAVHEAQIRAAA